MKMTVMPQQNEHAKPPSAWDECLGHELVPMTDRDRKVSDEIVGLVQSSTALDLPMPTMHARQAAARGRT